MNPAAPVLSVDAGDHWLTLEPVSSYAIRSENGNVDARHVESPAPGTAFAQCELGIWVVTADAGVLDHAGETVERLLLGSAVEVTVNGTAVRLEPVVRAEPQRVDAGQHDKIVVNLDPPTSSVATSPEEHVREDGDLLGSPSSASNLEPVHSDDGAPPPPESADVLTTLVVRGLSVGSEGNRRLDHVDVDLAAGEFMAVLGTSGAGKSTFLKALAAVEPANIGSIEFAGHDLYTEYDDVCRRIGYVPQDDILHTQLTVTETLRFAGRLRFPAGTTLDAIDERIDEVLRELGLVARSDARIDQLSGGQRKRVNVAVELLTRPDLLILDEPTSGLDPGNERSMMELLRELADHGRIVLVVTHSVESLHLCDSVLFLASGGVPVYLGAPAGLPHRFGTPDLTSVFVAVERLGDPTTQRVRPVPVEPRPPSMPRPPTRVTFDNATAAEFGRQFFVLTSRYVRVLASDRRNLTILGLQAPILAFLMLVVFGSGAFDLGAMVPTKAANTLTGMCLATIYLGSSNAVREIVKERTIFRRELTFGVSSGSYLASKFAVLGTVTTAQALLLVVTGTLLQRGPEQAVIWVNPKFELFLALALTGLVAVGCGLAISALSSTADRAMTLLPVLLFAQLLLGGTIFKLAAGVEQLSWLTPSRWGIAATGSTADLYELSACDLPGPPRLDTCSALWKHQAGIWLVGYVMLLALTAGVTYGCWRLLERLNPAKVLRAHTSNG